MESDFSNENKVIILLVSLPDSYDHLVTTLLHGSTTPILEDVIDSLIEYYHRKKDVSEVHGEDLYLKNQTCHKCHEKGHLRRDCPKN
ncbi:unnamed protein product [Spirodela intermedia]|uniref:CCHC-type domain-containing protein n=2 Tax=Spirodela intermedia TaxID=51605 RepID=A0A7I8IDA0_SPIIN|nr:unnamed protein product [Spirodela intermedia]CAA6654821.1 unnamed protein product [Spirodela intermedia]CAA7389507.1 unnamed protein product [Spirodela intermedia]